MENYVNACILSLQLKNFHFLLLNIIFYIYLLHHIQNLSKLLIIIEFQLQNYIFFLKNLIIYLKIFLNPLLIHFISLSTFR